MLPPAIHSFSVQRCHDNPHVTGYKHTTSLQGFALEKTQTGVTHTFFFFFLQKKKEPSFRDALFCGRRIKPTCQFYHVATTLSAEMGQRKYEEHQKSNCLKKSMFLYFFIKNYAYPKGIQHLSIHS